MRDAVLRLGGASLAYGARTLWSDLDLAVAPGEFLAVLGGNGAGKTSFLRVILGLQTLTSGSVLVDGKPPRRGSDAVGYVPQRTAEPLMPVRARDLVAAGIDGHRWGIAALQRRTFGCSPRGRFLAGGGRAYRERVEAALAAVGAQRLANRPFGELSGGEQQRVRIAQALVGDPRLLLCDELLSWLDLAGQRSVAALIDQHRREHGSAVIFVTHDINPALPYVDRVLYVADSGRHRLGGVDEVLTSEVLSDLHGTAVHVVRVEGKLLVAGR